MKKENIGYEKMRFLEWIIRNSHEQKDGSILLRLEIDNEKKEIVFNFEGTGYFGYTKGVG